MTGKLILCTIFALAVLGCAPPAPVPEARFAGLVGTKVDLLPADLGPTIRMVDMPDGHVTYVWDRGAAQVEPVKEQKFYTGMPPRPPVTKDCLLLVEADPAGVIVKVSHLGNGCT